MSEASTDKETELEESPAILADPGAMLTVAREAQGISLDRVARELGLTESAVKALEANKHDKFPAGIYVRGYIKNYCKILGISADAVMEVLEEFITLNGTLGSLGSNYDPLGEFGREKKESRSFVIPILVVVLALAGYLVYRVFFV